MKTRQLMMNGDIIDVCPQLHTTTQNRSDAVYLIFGLFLHGST